MEDMKEYLKDTKTKEALTWGWSETNVNWSLHMISKANYCGRKLHNNFKWHLYGDDRQYSKTAHV
eukprot:15328178-Ditylum_brightwellii.AAC.1